MPAFNFMETFFFLSLGITFVLLLVLVYHFKQKIAKTEEKVDTLFDIIQGLAKETADLRSRVAYVLHRPAFSGDQIFSQFHVVNEDMDENENNMRIHIQELDLGKPDGTGNLGEIRDITDDIIDDDEDEDDDEDDEDDEDYDEDYEDDYDEDTTKDDNEDGDDEDEVVIDMSNRAPFMKIKVEDDMLPVNHEVDTSLDIEETSNTGTETYKKMNLVALKQLVVSKGLVKDASKLKKHEILKLLG
jgi:hypothetical protein